MTWTSLTEDIYLNALLLLAVHNRNETTDSAALESFRALTFHWILTSQEHVQMSSKAPTTRVQIEAELYSDLLRC